MLFIFILFFTTSSRIIQGNLSFFENIADQSKQYSNQIKEYQLSVPHIVLFIVPFGARYSQIRSTWENNADVMQDEIQFVEVDCYEHLDAKDLFGITYYPQLMYIDKEGYYYMDMRLVQDMNIHGNVMNSQYISEFIKIKWSQLEKQKIIKSSLIIYLMKLILLQDNIIAFIIILSITFAIFFRLSIYRDNDCGKNKQD